MIREQGPPTASAVASRLQRVRSGKLGRICLCDTCVAAMPWRGEEREARHRELRAKLTRATTGP